MVAMDDSDWADVPADLLECIGGYLTFDGSDVSWRRVCKHWGAGLAKGVPEVAVSVPEAVNPSRWDEHMRYLSTHFPRARCFRLDVTLDVPPSLFRDQLAGVAWRCQKLQELQLAFQSRTYEVEDADFGAISTIPDLQVLDIRGGSYEGTRETLSPEARMHSPIRRLSSAHRLKALKFVPGKGGVWNVDLHALAALTNLSALELKVKSVSDEGLHALRRLQHLQSLTLHQLWLCSRGPASLTGEGLASLAGLAALLSLSLSVVNLNDVGEGELAALAGVKSLGLRARAPGADCVARLCMACKSNLTRLELEHVALDDSSLLSRLACLPALQDLRLSVYCSSRDDVHLDITVLGALPLKAFHLRLAPTVTAGHPPHAGQGRVTAQLDATALQYLAACWQQLESLSLQADIDNFGKGAMWVLGSFSALESVTIHVHQVPHAPIRSPRLSPRNKFLPPAPPPLQVWLCALPPNLLHLQLHNVELLPPVTHPLHTRQRKFSLSSLPLLPVGSTHLTHATGPTAESAAESSNPVYTLPLLSLHLEYCTTPRRLLCALFPHVPSLSSLRLHEVQPMDDTTIAHLAMLTELTSLSVYAPISPRNHAVTQASLALLPSHLLKLKELKWVSFDMTLGGPKLEVFRDFKSLKKLVLLTSQVTDSAVRELKAAFREQGTDCCVQLLSRFEMMDNWHMSFWS